MYYIELVPRGMLTSQWVMICGAVFILLSIVFLLLSGRIGDGWSVAGSGAFCIGLVVVMIGFMVFMFEDVNDKEDRKVAALESHSELNLSNVKLDGDGISFTASDGEGRDVIGILDPEGVDRYRVFIAISIPD